MNLFTVPFHHYNDSHGNDDDNNDDDDDKEEMDGWIDGSCHSYMLKKA